MWGSVSEPTLGSDLHQIPQESAKQVRARGKKKKKVVEGKIIGKGVETDTVPT